MVFCRPLFLSRAAGTGRRCSALSSSRSTVLCLSVSAHLTAASPLRMQRHAIFISFVSTTSPPECFQALCRQYIHQDGLPISFEHAALAPSLREYIARLRVLLREVSAPTWPRIPGCRACARCRPAARAPGRKPCAAAPAAAPPAPPRWPPAPSAMPPALPSAPPDISIIHNKHSATTSGFPSLQTPLKSLPSFSKPTFYILLILRPSLQW